MKAIVVNDYLKLLLTTKQKCSSNHSQSCVVIKRSLAAIIVNSQQSTLENWLLCILYSHRNKRDKIACVSISHLRNLMEPNKKKKLFYFIIFDEWIASVLSMVSFLFSLIFIFSVCCSLLSVVLPFTLIHLIYFK